LPTDPAIAEIGVGTGRIAIPFIEKGICYTGFDISDQMMQLLGEKLGGDFRRGQVLTADVTESLPIDAQSQDAVMAVHILHLVDIRKALTQIRRVLKPHGALVWGYEWHDDQSVRMKIRSKFREHARALGGLKSREFIPPEGRNLLLEWGADPSQHVVTTWALEETCQQILDGLRSRVLSFTWEMDEAIVQKAADLTEAWAVQEFGDLKEPRESDQSFLVDWYQF
jgi:ubiquinone/menaquinone biosynthesis C-methylase UbiE